MSSQSNFPRVISVEALKDKKLRVRFDAGISKIYDCTPLLSDAPFDALRDEFLFRSVHVEPHGYAIIWNDDLDLAESDLWLNGAPDTGLTSSSPVQ